MTAGRTVKMPLYEYKCKSCEKKFDVIENFEDTDTDKCIYCSSNDIKRVIHAPLVVFKGSGFYATEYGKQKSYLKKDSEEGSDSPAASPASGDSPPGKDTQPAPSDGKPSDK